MIISKEVKETINRHNVEHYRNLGYIVKSKDSIIIPIKDIALNSSALIEVKCEKCEKKLKKPYNKYVKNKKCYYFSCSHKCSAYKRTLTFLDKYGVEHISQLEEIKQKKIETCLLNNGTEHPMQNKKIFEKSKKTNLEKYGVENVSQSEEIKQKKIETCLFNYGVENPMQYIKNKEKSKETCKKKYGLNTFINQKKLNKRK